MKLKKGAIISPCGKYRYLLTRVWKYDKPTLIYIGLNPSTADGYGDDHTTTKLRKYAKRLGYGSYILLNVYAYRSKNREILGTVEDPVGPDNGKLLRMWAKSNHDVIFMFGASKFITPEIVSRMSHLFPKAKCFKKSKDGLPIHPLYLPYDIEPIKFR